ncbi:hypothetical protein [Corynebacterium senegalense]|uniref:hypothetical protein n=1 Tax=Corynebacterium senegalense TaxID=2080750 RepID=UPI000E20151C|nr:hypothetical protein [Corynebacterium senegalense]
MATRVTTSEVLAHLGLKDADTEQLEMAVAAVNEQVTQWHGYDAADDFSKSHLLGGTMLAAHLYRRRNTPGGVEQFNELGIAYVQRSDPHVSQLLGLGAWTPPRVG